VVCGCTDVGSQHRPAPETGPTDANPLVARLDPDDGLTNKEPNDSRFQPGWWAPTNARSP